MIKTDVESAAIGRRVEQARKRAGFTTRSEAARKLGKANSTYQGWEKGTRGLNPKHAAEIAEIFQCSPAWLLTGEDNEIDSATGERPIPSKTVPVIGTVGGAGLLRLSEMKEPELRVIPAQVEKIINGYKLHAWQVLDDSIDKEAPNAKYVIGILYEDLKRDPRPSELVLLERSAGEEYFSRVIRMCQTVGDKIVYEPVSHNPEHKAITIEPPSEQFLETKPLALIVNSSASHLPEGFEI